MESGMSEGLDGDDVSLYKVLIMVEKKFPWTGENLSWIARTTENWFFVVKIS